MASSVAGSAPSVKNGVAVPPFFQEKPVISLVGGALHIDKASLRSKLQSAPSVPEADDGFFLRLLSAIRRFLARVCRAILPSKFFSPTGSDNSHHSSGFGGDSFASPQLSETEDELILDGVPEQSVGRVSQTIDDLIGAVSGDKLSHSLRSALTMPELGRRQAFKVLLEMSGNDLRQVDAVRQELRAQISTELDTFAREYLLSPEEALTLFRADLESGSGVIAGRADPDGRISALVVELKKLDSSALALSQSLKLICAEALDAGAMTREDFSGTEFKQYLPDVLDVDAEQEASLAALVVEPVESDTSGSKAVVVSLSDFRSRRMAGPTEAGDTVTPAGDGSTEKALASLVEREAFDEKEAQRLNAAIELDSVLSDEALADDDVAAMDDLSTFFKKSGGNKPSPKQ